MKFIDLQVHTNASDGKLNPRDVVDLAVKRGVKVIAITDHDTISGIEEAIEYSNGKNIEVVPGIEISCREKGFHSLIDVIGLFIDYKNEKLSSLIKKIKSARIKERKNIIRRLNNPLFRRITEKFNRELIEDFKRIFVPREKSSIKEAIEIIKQAKGIPILAHPGRYGNEMIKIINKFAEAGGKGVEADYPYDKIVGIDISINKKIKEIARDKGLLISGGSDFHDSDRGVDIGDAGIDKKEFAILKKSLN